MTEKIEAHLRLLLLYRKLVEIFHIASECNAAEFLRDGTNESLSGTADKTVNPLASLSFMDRPRFTLSNRVRTRPYETFIIT